MKYFYIILGGGEISKKLNVMFITIFGPHILAVYKLDDLSQDNRKTNQVTNRLLKGMRTRVSCGMRS